MGETKTAWNGGWVVTGKKSIFHLITLLPRDTGSFLTDKVAGRLGRWGLKEATGSIHSKPSTDVSVVFPPCWSLDWHHPDRVDKLTHPHLSFHKHSPPLDLSLPSLWPFEGELTSSFLPLDPQGWWQQGESPHGHARFPHRAVVGGKKPLQDSLFFNGSFRARQISDGVSKLTGTWPLREPRLATPSQHTTLQCEQGRAGLARPPRLEWLPSALPPSLPPLPSLSLPLPPMSSLPSIFLHSLSLFCFYPFLSSLILLPQFLFFLPKSLSLCPSSPSLPSLPLSALSRLGPCLHCPASSISPPVPVLFLSPHNPVLCPPLQLCLSFHSWILFYIEM